MQEITKLGAELGRIGQLLEAARLALHADEWDSLAELAGAIGEAAARCGGWANVVAYETDVDVPALEVPASAVQPDIDCPHCGSATVEASVHAWRCLTCGRGSGEARAS
jgi:hypothetical protein